MSKSRWWCCWGPIALGLLGAVAAACREPVPDDAPIRSQSPLDSYVAADTDRRQAEERIQTCMTEAGFDYELVLQDPPDFISFVVIDEELSEEQFIDRYGWGIVTLASRQAGYAPIDANDERINAMSPREQEAYFAALLGEEDHLGPAGCYREGYRAQIERNGELAAHYGLYEEGVARYRADPRVVEREQQWSACMADEGYHHSDPEALEVDLLNQLWASEGDGGPADGRRLRALSLYELDVAASSYRCGYGPFSGFPELVEVQFEHERELLATISEPDPEQ